jgi:hypothetical protein
MDVRYQLSTVFSTSLLLENRWNHDNGRQLLWEWQYCRLQNNWDFLDGFQRFSSSNLVQKNQLKTVGPVPIILQVVPLIGQDEYIYHVASSSTYWTRWIYFSQNKIRIYSTYCAYTSIREKVQRWIACVHMHMYDIVYIYIYIHTHICTHTHTQYTYTHTSM